MTTDATKAAQEADLVIEAIVENMAVKKSLFKLIAASAPKGINY